MNLLDLAGEIDTIEELRNKIIEVMNGYSTAVSASALLDLYIATLVIYGRHPQLPLDKYMGHAMLRIQDFAIKEIDRVNEARTQRAKGN